MKNKKAFRLIISIAFFTFLYAANVYSQEGDISDETGNYEYMSIVTRVFDSKLSRIYISKPNGEYKEISRDIEKEKIRFNFIDVHTIIEKLDQEGWEIVSSNMVFTGTSSDEEFYVYYFLKR